MSKMPSRGVNCLVGSSGVFSDTGLAKNDGGNGPSGPNQPVRWHDGPSACPFGSGSVFMLGGVAQGMPPKSGLFCGRRGRRKAPSRMEATIGGALPPARGDLDDFVTSPMHDGTRWAVPRTAGRAVVGLGVARRPAWVGHAAPIVTRGRHVFTEAGRVHGSWRAPRGDDSRPRSPPRS